MEGSLVVIGPALGRGPVAEPRREGPERVGGLERVGIVRELVGLRLARGPSLDGNLGGECVHLVHGGLQPRQALLQELHAGGESDASETRGAAGVRWAPLGMTDENEQRALDAFRLYWVLTG